MKRVAWLIITFPEVSNYSLIIPPMSCDRMYSFKRYSPIPSRIKVSRNIAFYAKIAFYAIESHFFELQSK